MSKGLMDRITVPSLFYFVLPTIVMNVFLALYNTIDGIFTARYVGEDSISALNIVLPIITVVQGVAVMLATGGGAIISRQLGQNQEQEARENFTFILLVGAILSLMASAVCFLWMEPIIYALGSNDVLYPICYEYMYYVTFFLPAFLFQTIFQYFFVMAGKPVLGMLIVGAAGCTHLVLDVLLMGWLELGVKGAAVAGGIACLIPMLVGLFYFWIKRDGLIYLVWPKTRWRVLIQTMGNGSSELVTQLSSAVITFLFNITLMKLYGENGVTSIAVITYAEYIVMGIFIGYSSGVAPLISFFYGKKDSRQQKKIFRYSHTFIGSISVICFCITFWLADPIVRIFLAPDSKAYSLSIIGLKIYSFSFLLKGLNAYYSAMFTAFSNGYISAMLSFLRTFVFIAAGILILPQVLSTEGVWLAVPAAEILAFGIGWICLIKYKSRYGYLGEQNLILKNE